MHENTCRKGHSPELLKTKPTRISHKHSSQNPFSLDVKFRIQFTLYILQCKVALI